MNILIEGISHITFIVKDLNRSAHLFKYIFDAEEIYSSDKRAFSISEEKFFLVNEDIWIVLMKGNSLNSKTYNHTALKIDEKDYDAYLVKINELGLEIKPSRSRIKGEGKSIYFYDYDNHLFELHTGTLEERLFQYSEYKPTKSNN